MLPVLPVTPSKFLIVNSIIRPVGCDRVASSAAIEDNERVNNPPPAATTVTAALRTHENTSRRGRDLGCSVVAPPSTLLFNGDALRTVGEDAVAFMVAGTGAFCPLGLLAVNPITEEGTVNPTNNIPSSQRWKR
jgi:hypothetical protein